MKNFVESLGGFIVTFMSLLFVAVVFLWFLAFMSGLWEPTTDFKLNYEEVVEFLSRCDTNEGPSTITFEVGFDKKVIKVDCNNGAVFYGNVKKN